ncbi:MAG: hypothetical protein ACI8PZ_003206 [Myxococcota bacterium]|jgi:hypothetical protein
MRVLPLLALAACTAEPVVETEPFGPVGIVAPAEDGLRFGFPLAEPDLVVSAAVGVDHDPQEQEGVLAAALCTNYDGQAFPYCYDQHDGSDFLLVDGFTTMDEGSVDVLAAADGVVISIEEEQYDRCHIEGTGISCDGYDVIGNHVIVEHADGTVSKYWHLMQYSVRVDVGDEVTCGDVMAKVGSSGVSSGPHLHFEVETADGVSFDPYAGAFSQEETWWAEQKGIDELPGPGCTAAE